MAKSKKAACFATLMLTTALTAPVALAQEEQNQPETPETNAETPNEEPEEVEMVGPGAGSDNVIVVQGRYIPDPIRDTAAVVSVLGEAEIARTGRW